MLPLFGGFLPRSLTIPILLFVLCGMAVIKSSSSSSSSAQVHHLVAEYPHDVIPLEVHVPPRNSGCRGRRKVPAVSLSATPWSFRSSPNPSKVSDSSKGSRTSFFRKVLSTSRCMTKMRHRATLSDLSLPYADHPPQMSRSCFEDPTTVAAVDDLVPAAVRRATVPDLEIEKTLTSKSA